MIYTLAVDGTLRRPDGSIVVGREKEQELQKRADACKRHAEDERRYLETVTLARGCYVESLKPVSLHEQIRSMTSTTKEQTCTECTE